MDTTVRQKRRRLTIGFAGVGFFIAAFIYAYFELTDSSLPTPLNFPLLTTFVILCPPSLLSFFLIDVESAGGIAVVWLVFALLNSALYACVGMLVGKLLWKINGQTAGQNVTSK